MAQEAGLVQAPGLKWIKRTTHGVLRRSPYWVAADTAVDAGYLPKTINLTFLADSPDMLVAKCNALQADMLLWRSGYRRDMAVFDGTIKSLLTIYQKDDLRPGSKVPYNHYLEKIEAHIGQERIDDITGLDLKRWHAVWSSDGKHLAAASMARAVLDAAVSYGVMSRTPGCSAFSEVLKIAKRKLPQPKRREIALVAEQIEAARRAAHADGRASSALAYAIAFETTLRLWDVIGQWWPMDTAIISDVVDARRDLKWFGLRWEDIDERMVLRHMPSKTSGKTGRSITFPLTSAPMVMEELANWPVEARRGPVIVYESTGKPYTGNDFSRMWRRDRAAAGIPAAAWARDLRASGITEGRAAGGSTDDAAKVAGHSTSKTTAAVYDRANLEAAERFATSRATARKTSGNSRQ